MRTMTARERIEAQYGSIREGLLTELQRRTPPQLAQYWDVHVNTVRAWMMGEDIERFVGYRVREPEPAGAR